MTPLSISKWLMLLLGLLATKLQAEFIITRPAANQSFMVGARVTVEAEETDPTKSYPDLLIAFPTGLSFAPEQYAPNKWRASAELNYAGRQHISFHSSPTALFAYVNINVSPANDHFSAPGDLTVKELATWGVRGSLDGGTLEPGETAAADEMSVWYRFTLPATANYAVQYNPELPGIIFTETVVYTGTSLQNLTVLGRVPKNQQTIIRGQAGQQWFFQAKGTDNPAFFSPFFSLSVIRLADNDTIESAFDLSPEASGEYLQRTVTGVGQRGRTGYLFWKYTPATDGYAAMEREGFISRDGVRANSLPNPTFLRAGEEVYIGVSGGSTETTTTGHFYFAPNAPKPANDDFANRTVVTGDADLTASIKFATADTQDDYFGGNLWYEFRAPAEGFLDFHATGQWRRPHLHAFRGESLRTLVAGPDVYESGEGRYVRTRMVAGEKIQLRVSYRIFDRRAEAVPPTFNLKFRFNAPPVPPNDQYPNAIELSGAAWDVKTRIEGTTQQTGEPFPMQFFKFVPPADGLAQFQVSADFQTAFRVMRPAANAFGLEFVGPSLFHPDGIVVHATAGEPLYLGVGGDSVLGELRIRGDFHAAGENDNFANARVITGVYARVFGDHSTATVEPNEPIHAQNADRKSLWYRWTAPASGQLGLLGLTVTNFPVAIAVYTGNSLSTLTRVPFTPNIWPQDSYTVTAGQTYHIAVDKLRNYHETAYSLLLRLDVIASDGGRVEFMRLLPDNRALVRHHGIPGYRYRFSARSQPGKSGPAQNLAEYRMPAEGFKDHHVYVSGNSFFSAESCDCYFFEQ